MKNIIIVGPSRSGKSTLAKRMYQKKLFHITKRCMKNLPNMDLISMIHLKIEIKYLLKY